MSSLIMLTSTGPMQITIACQENQMADLASHRTSACKAKDSNVLTINAFALMLLTGIPKLTNACPGNQKRKHAKKPTNAWPVSFVWLVNALALLLLTGTAKLAYEVCRLSGRVRLVKLSFWVYYQVDLSIYSLKGKSAGTTIFTVYRAPRILVLDL